MLLRAARKHAADCHIPNTQCRCRCALNGSLLQCCIGSVLRSRHSAFAYVKYNIAALIALNISCRLVAVPQLSSHLYRLYSLLMSGLYSYIASLKGHIALYSAHEGLYSPHQRLYSLVYQQREF
jgi:hypothetical protein